MAAGDTFTIHQSVAVSGFLLLQPVSGNEVSLHNIIPNCDWELYKTDGTNDIKADSGSANDSRFGVSLHCTNSIYYKVKNIGATATYVSADGMYTK